MKLSFESRAEIAVVERLTGRKVLHCEPIVMYQPELATLIDSEETEVIYFGTFEHNTKASDVSGKLVTEDNAVDGGLQTVNTGESSDSGFSGAFNHRAWTYLDSAGSEGQTMFYGWKMTLMSHEFGSEIVQAGDFPDPNEQWAESKPDTASFTYGQPGVSYDDNSVGTGGSLSQFIPEPITSPTGRFKVAFELLGGTTGNVNVSLNGGTKETTSEVSDGLHEQILNLGVALENFAVRISADFDGVVISVSITPVLI